ncbi:MAG: hypothetical protein F6K42_09275, partial [Leptolyngbya sp. SIO1D8]|nr:hypothetical protein [Leptolyngbya sp. SIO1D8]
VRSRLLPVFAISTTLLTTGATLPTETANNPTIPQVADVTINVPVVIPHYPVIVVPRREREEAREVTVQFTAQGNDWATIYLNNRLLFRASNTRRNYTVTLEPGAYYLEITGVSRFEVWGSGYLDVGRDDSNIVVVRYSKNGGIQVAGDPYAWIPD